MTVFSPTAVPDEPAALLKFGIITPAYNRPVGLRRAVESVRAQSHQSWCHVVIDDSGSGLVSEELLRRDARTVVIANDVNSGTNRSRNAGLDALVRSVDYVTFLDDDDRLDENALAVAAQYITATGASWAVSRRVSAVSGESFTSVTAGQVQYDYVYDCMVEGRLTGDATHFVSSELIRASGARFPDEDEYLAEWRFWARIGSLSNIEFFEGAITLGAEYAPDNQSSVMSNDVAFRARDVADLCRFFQSCDVPSSRQGAVTAMLRSQIALIVPRVLAVRRTDLLTQIVRSARPVDIVANATLHRRLLRLLVVGSWHRLQRAARLLQR
jgi:glycosyltransferase involved in cell wall biosynthesis